MAKTSRKPEDGQNLEKTKTKSKTSDTMGHSSKSWPSMVSDVLFFVFFGFLEGFCIFGRLAKTSRKPQKKQKKTRQTPWASPPRAGHPWCLTFCFFWFSLRFLHFWETSQNLEKTTKKTKTKRQTPWASPPRAGHPWCLTFCFFVFFWFSRRFLHFWETSQNLEKTTKKQKQNVRHHGPLLQELAVHDVWRFVFFVFWFSRRFLHFWETSQNLDSTTKKQKQNVRHHGPLLQELAIHGVWRFVFFVFFWFSRSFLHFWETSQIIRPSMVSDILFFFCFLKGFCILDATRFEGFERLWKRARLRGCGKERVSAICAPPPPSCPLLKLIGKSCVSYLIVAPLA